MEQDCRTSSSQCNRVARSFLRSARNVLAKAESRNRLLGELDCGIHVGDMATAIANKTASIDASDAAIRPKENTPPRQPPDSGHPWMKTRGNVSGDLGRPMPSVAHRRNYRTAVVSKWPPTDAALIFVAPSADEKSTLVFWSSPIGQIDGISLH
jgi:hypothetical protein